ncbi:MAG: LytR/AlgR family response regulator transcription factor [Alphaproteobacteria bacterium]
MNDPRPIRALIVDDEPLALDGLELRLQRHPDVVVVGKCDDSVRALEDIAAGAANVVFLDIKMPRLDGLRLARVLQGDQAPLIIFTTAFDHYAVDAFEANAIDYLLKPVSNARLDEALDRVRAELTRADRARQARHLLSLLSRLQGSLPAQQGDALSSELARLEAAGIPSIEVSHAGRTFRLPASEIDFLTADRDYVHVHAGNRRFVVRDTMRSMIGRLEPAGFMRIHRSAIVNMRKVREYRTGVGGRPALVMETGNRLPVGKSYRKAVMEHLEREGAAALPEEMRTL